MKTPYETAVDTRELAIATGLKPELILQAARDPEDADYRFFFFGPARKHACLSFNECREAVEVVCLLSDRDSEYSEAWVVSDLSHTLDRIKKFFEGWVRDKT